MGILDRFFGSTQATPSAPEHPLQQEQDALFALKRDALELAAATARHENRQPTLTDYVTAAESLRSRAEVEGLQWNSRVYADLSGQTIHGFLIQMEDAKAAGHDFENNLRFDRSIFDETCFRPATSYEPERARGASFTNVTFDGMQGDDHVTLVRLDNGRGGDVPYRDIRFSDIRGGTITVADGANIKGLNIEGATANLEVGRASISNMNAVKAHILSFRAERGAQFTSATFNGSTIDGNSQLAGTIWNNVTFDGTNLDSVDLRQAQLTNVSFVEAHVSNMDIRGARLKDVTFVGVDVRRLRFDVHTRFTGVMVNGQRIDSPEALQAMITTQNAMEASRGAGLMLESARSGITAPTIEAPRVEAASTVPLALANPGAGIESPTIATGDPRNIWAQEAPPPKQPPIPVNGRLANIATSMQRNARDQDAHEFLRVKEQKNAEFRARMARMHPKQP